MSASEGRRGVWSEEEMREIEPEARGPGTGARGYVAGLRRELSGRNVERAAGGFAHEVTRGAGAPSVIYAPERGLHGNFVDASYRRICAKPQWHKRLEKAHTSKRQGVRAGWCELDSANSSDALLMNVFCYPRVLGKGRLAELLGVEPGTEPVFGYKPRIGLKRGLVDTTEVDMKVGDLLVEAKLTETDFQAAPMRKLERYVDFRTVFEAEALEMDREMVRSYQLVRGVLAAYAGGGRFCVVCDARRPDMVAAWLGVMRAVRSFELRSRLRMHTWQEIAGVVPGTLREFLGGKYGIGAG